MCGIAGIIYRNGGGQHEVGRDMTRMLQAMKHRGPDSTGYALYRPEADGYVMHVKLAEATATRASTARRCSAARAGRSSPTSAPWAPRSSAWTPATTTR